MKSLREQREDEAWFAGPGELGERIRSHHWPSTPLGAIETWPASLRSAVNLVMASPLPCLLTWGEQGTQIFNDAFLPILGPRHPRALGQPFEDCWHGAFPGTGLPLRTAATPGLDENQRLFLTRDDRPRDSRVDELFFTHAVTGILDERGLTAGHLHQLVDVTAAALGARRMRVLAQLSGAAEADTLEGCLTAAARALAQSEADLPLLLFYAVDDAGTGARLVAGTALPPGGPGHPEHQELSPPTAETGAWPLAAALKAQGPLIVTDVQARFPGLTAGPYPEPITIAFVLPAGAGPAGAKALIVAGVSQRARLDDAYTAFYGLLGAGLGNAIARIRSSITVAKLRQESADKLAEVNKELEAFSYSVSHDLRTPLRAIDGFSRALLTEQGAKLDEQGRRYLERIRAGTQRMAELIDDLLSLSRITRATLRHERVDLSAIARRVLNDLARRDPARTVEVVVADGLVAQADARLITALFENLLGNAWKFSSKTAHARIEVTSEPHHGGVAFVVRDNGAGFNMDHAKKLFEPFQRLHSASEFPGTGIGLATVHRIVTRHRGRIWAQAAPDQGAAFHFTLGEPA